MPFPIGTSSQPQGMCARGTGWEPTVIPFSRSYNIAQTTHQNIQNWQLTLCWSLQQLNNSIYITSVLMVQLHLVPIKNFPSAGLLILPTPLSPKDTHTCSVLGRSQIHCTSKPTAPTCHYRQLLQLTTCTCPYHQVGPLCLFNHNPGPVPLHHAQVPSTAIHM